MYNIDIARPGAQKVQGEDFTTHQLPDSPKAAGFPGRQTNALGNFPILELSAADGHCNH